MSDKRDIGANLDEIRNLLNLETNDVISHNLYGIHIKELNNALSDEYPHICIGWSVLGDLSEISTKDELTAVYERYFTKSNRGKGQDVGQIWRFVKDIKKGDYVIFADNNVCHIGRVESDYYFDTTDNPDQNSDYKNSRKVTWLKKNINRSSLSKNLHNCLKTAMSIWSMNDYKSAVLDILNGCYVKDDEYITEEESAVCTFDSIAVSEIDNLVVYGTPGCGKSFHVKNTLLKGYEDDNIIRTTFYQDYTNTDFVGQIMPNVSGENVTYDFNPGPFSLALKQAIQHPDELIALVIEELNRGNAPSIFGDIFQLLDRKDGKSEYKITNVNVQKYLADNIPDMTFEYIMIPANLTIVATMNTSDQNVFTLDTAFKRRWDFLKLKNKFVTEGENAHPYRELLVPGLKNCTWEKFVTEINDFIVYNASDLQAEDKQLGVFFVKRELLAETEQEATDKIKAERFAYKVLEYLWDDVAKFDRDSWFVSNIKSLDELVEQYTIVGKEVFKDGIFKITNS